jgi:hypothetical protein
MTTKANAVLRKMRKQKSPFKLFRNPKSRDRILEDFNNSTLDPVGPIGGEQGAKLLTEINSLEGDHQAFMKSLAPSVNVL